MPEPVWAGVHLKAFSWVRQLGPSIGFVDWVRRFSIAQPELGELDCSAPTSASVLAPEFVSETVSESVPESYTRCLCFLRPPDRLSRVNWEDRVGRVAEATENASRTLDEVAWPFVRHVCQPRLHCCELRNSCARRRVNETHRTRVPTACGGSAVCLRPCGAVGARATAGAQQGRRKTVPSLDRCDAAVTAPRTARSELG